MWGKGSKVKGQWVHVWWSTLYATFSYLQLWRSYTMLSATTIMCSKCPPLAKTRGWPWMRESLTRKPHILEVEINIKWIGEFTGISFVWKWAKSFQLQGFRPSPSDGPGPAGDLSLDPCYRPSSRSRAPRANHGPHLPPIWQILDPPLNSNIPRVNKPCS